MKGVRQAFVAAMLCAALLAIEIPASVGAAQNHPFLFSISKFTPEPNVIEHFEAPCGLAVDQTGALYVSDYYHHKIDVFNSSADPLTQLKEVEPLDGPCGLAVEASGALFANVLHRSVIRFTPAVFPIVSKAAYGVGTQVDSGHPTGIAYGLTSGNLYVDDRTYIAVYEPSGSPVEVGGEPLRIGLGSLEDGYGVAVSSFPATAGFLYVPDAATDTIKVYDPASDLLNPVQVIDGKGTPLGKFTTLRDAAVAVDQASGHLFLSFNSQGPFYEHPRAAIVEFNAAGEYRGSLPSPTPLWFGEPSGIAVDNSPTATKGRVYVSTGNSELESVLQKAEKPEEDAVYAFGPSAAGQRLEVTLAGAGTGRVESQPAGISCPGACAAEYDEGGQVKLTPSASPGSAFVGWSGDCTGAGLCTVAMSAAKAVVAQFEVAPVGGAQGGDEGAAAAEAAPSAEGRPAPMVPALPVEGTTASARIARARLHRAEQRREARQRRSAHRHRRAMGGERR